MTDRIASHAYPLRQIPERIPSVGAGWTALLTQLHQDLAALAPDYQVDTLRVSLAAADDKLVQLDQRSRRAITFNLGIPAFGEIAGRTATVTVTPTRSRDVADKSPTEGPGGEPSGQQHHRCQGALSRAVLFCVVLLLVT